MRKFFIVALLGLTFGIVGLTGCDVENGEGGGMGQQPPGQQPPGQQPDQGGLGGNPDRSQGGGT